MMKFIGLIILCSFTIIGVSQDLQYYLPDSVTYNPAIPKPKEIIYHEVGEWHVTHDRLVNYMKAVAEAAPDRVKMETFGFTYELRPQVLLIITSKKNHQNLEQIRQQHVQLTDATRSASLNIENMPVVVWVGHSIHGNEPSGANAALVSAYYLAAAQGKQIDDLLDNVVILLDPAFNPDGLQRFSTWVNQHRSKNLVVDPNSREFNEVWPGGRFNHYWFDLNRDWLPAVHVESQNRLKKFHEWKPNILTDHHEMGSNTTFFFQPGVPSRVNPLTPEKNQELTAKIGTYHAAFLDRIGSLYFTKEGYDDFYYGKGSTYPDVNGAIGILFEQASSRGHAQQTQNGVLRFPFTIKNQFTTTLSTLEAAKALRKELLLFQRDFYKSVQSEAASSTIKAYVFGDERDMSKTKDFITTLQRHEIDIYTLNNNIKPAGSSEEFKRGTSFIIPTNQKQHRLIRAIFEKTLTYKDSLFYDITSWTMPLAYGLPYAEIKVAQYNNNLIGEKYTPGNYKGEVMGGRSEYAYLIEWSEFNAPAGLYSLQNSGVAVKVATNPIELVVAGGRKRFNYGTILIPVQSQNKTSAEIYNLVTNVSQKFNLSVHAVTTGAATIGSDLGSNRFITVTKPVIATVTGTGVDPINAGELWHLMDQRFNIPISQLEPALFNRVSLDKYNTIILVGGTYGDLNKEKLKTWVQNGGTLILLEEAVSWAAQNGISNVVLKKTKPVVDSTVRLSYIEREQIEGAQQVRGAILRAEADLTHPLAYGYTQPFLNTFKANKVFVEPGKNPFVTPFYYKDKPLESGWISRENLNNIKNSAAVVVSGLGSGKIISITDNPNFRGFWLGGSKLMMNSIFFGKMIATNFSATDE
jgi:hypothetical protein